MAATIADDIELVQHHNHEHIDPALISRPFAGRIGGNQQFTVSPENAEFDKITAKAPDAAANFSWKASLDLRGFSDTELWKQATIEGVGTGLQIYLSSLYSLGLFAALPETSLGPIVPAALGSVTNAVLLPLFIYAGGPVSGGHFNPLITLSTFFARLSTLPRTVLYVLFQCTGSLCGSFLMRASLGRPPAELIGIPGCYINTALVSPGQAYVFETMAAFSLVFLAFGFGLDPRQRDVFGPALSPILVGLALGLCSFAAGFVKEGFSGASLNPARCFGLMAAAGTFKQDSARRALIFWILERFDYHYINWLGDLTAAMVNGLMYWCIPIYKD
ncbi:MIP transporter [Lepidopterella palustris CBS 459.81]|uniref:MIP transporter n=1 Tax=Lepidopterella palustris CBS 459.81 TaxID=1314670 RepID=A0A8E2JA03_9PEZI|nr:MIP transporter [Lepidopterella palustris CBS 459.81]